MIVYMGKKVKYVHIDAWDTWDMDASLAPIILPMLKQLKETKQGAPFVYNEDVPENLHTDYTGEEAISEPFEERWFARWDYVLDEMIWAFQWAVDGKDVLVDVPDEDYREYSERLANGYRLFGKYYQCLWD